MITLHVLLLPAGPKTISSRPTWQRGDATYRMNPDESDGEDEDSEAGSSILALGYSTRIPREQSATPSHLPFLQRENSLIS